MTATNLRSMLRDPSIELATISSHLDSMSHSARLAEVCFLGKKEQARLFDIARGQRPITIDHFVPRATAPMREVVHHGKNTLPVFTRFAKVFCRPETSGGGASGRELWGYNRTNGFLGTVVGPGYYVAYDHGQGEVLVDYLRIPAAHPAGWPEILPNSARLSRFVYNGTQDVLRGVSSHVTIGRARRGEQWMNAWFVLCREDAAD